VLRHENLLDDSSACLLVIDVQERFAPHIENFEQLVSKIVTMAKGAAILNLPIIVTEQYVKGLGPTVKPIKDACLGAQYFEKNCFPVTTDAFLAHLESLGRKQVIVTGIETHVCVNQSVHELLRHSYQVHVIEDAVGSREAVHRSVGLKKMERAGAIISSTETALFEMLKEAGTARFKEVQALVK
jgi:nicotinamidase-related amidase